MLPYPTAMGSGRYMLHTLDPTHGNIGPKTSPPDADYGRFANRFRGGDVSMELNHPFMSRLFLALFLLCFGANLAFRLGLPNWLIGVLAMAAGALLLLERGGYQVVRKK